MQQLLLLRTSSANCLRHFCMNRQKMTTVCLTSHVPAQKPSIVALLYTNINHFLWKDRARDNIAFLYNPERCRYMASFLALLLLVRCGSLNSCKKASAIT